MKKQTTYTIEMDSHLSAELWQLLTSSFDVEIIRRQHTADGYNQIVSVRIAEKGSADEKTWSLV